MRKAEWGRWNDVKRRWEEGKLKAEGSKLKEEPAAVGG
jgi:hypothetical protein